MDSAFEATSVSSEPEISIAEIAELLSRSDAEMQESVSIPASEVIAEARIMILDSKHQPFSPRQARPCAPTHRPSCQQ